MPAFHDPSLQTAFTDAHTWVVCMDHKAVNIGDNATESLQWRRFVKSCSVLIVIVCRLDTNAQNATQIKTHSNARTLI